MDLVEAYYAVAARLREQAERMLETSEMLAGAADRMSEARMREKPAPDAGLPCPYGQKGCESTKGGVCVCTMPEAMSGKP